MWLYPKRLCKVSDKGGHDGRDEAEKDPFGF